MKRWLARVGIALAIVLVLAQLWPAGRTNPPATSPLAAPPEVASVLRRSCYDCHSNETTWPWYAYVAPVSWIVVHDVEEGREHLNFSTWGAYEAKKRMSAAEEVVEEVEDGKMPLPAYVRMHPEAAVSAAELDALRRWAESVE